MTTWTQADLGSGAYIACDATAICDGDGSAIAIAWKMSARLQRVTRSRSHDCDEGWVGEKVASAIATLASWSCGYMRRAC